jgi:hypothetical protein
MASCKNAYIKGGFEPTSLQLLKALAEVILPKVLSEEDQELNGLAKMEASA